MIQKLVFMRKYVKATSILTSLISLFPTLKLRTIISYRFFICKEMEWWCLKKSKKCCIRINVCAISAI